MVELLHGEEEANTEEVMDRMMEKKGCKMKSRKRKKKMRVQDRITGRLDRGESVIAIKSISLFLSEKKSFINNINCIPCSRCWSVSAISFLFSTPPPLHCQIEGKEVQQSSHQESRSHSHRQ